MPHTQARNFWFASMAVVVLLVAAFQNASASNSKSVAIIGGTLIDLTNYGRSTNDTPDSVILIDNGKITAAGPSSRVKIPAGVTRIDARGKFLIPGLIDGFGALRNQAFANSYLFDGVTTVYVGKILPNGGGDGETKILRDALPSPHLFLGAPMTGYAETGADPSDKPMTEHRLHDRRLSNEELIARIDRLADEGYRGVTISYDVWPDQVDVIVAEAKRRGLATVGELGFTTYPYGVRAGIDALLRNDIYQMECAPLVDQMAFADNQKADGPAFRAVCNMDLSSSEVTTFGQQLASSHTALMPTLVLEATADSLDIPNPWSAPSAAIINAADLDTPVDKATGASGYLAPLSPERRELVRKCARHKKHWMVSSTNSGLNSLLPRSRPRMESCRAVACRRRSHCCIALDSLLAKLLRLQPATMLMSTAGATSAGSSLGE